MLSPTQLEDRYVTREHQLYTWLAGRNSAWSILLVVGLGLISFFTHSEIESVHPVLESLFYIAPYLNNTILILLATSIIVTRISTAAAIRLIPPLSLAISLYAGYAFVKPETLGATEALAIAFIPVVLLLASLYVTVHKVRRSPWLALVIYTILHFAWVLYVLSHLESWGHFHLVAYLFGFKTVLFWFWVCSRVHKGDLTILELSIPVNAIRAWPWPSRDRELISKDRFQRNTVWWNGVFNILLGYILLGTMASFMSVFAYGNLFVNYAVHILVDVGTLNIIVGCARLFGFNLIDGTYFSFLAKSPAELWRRGSVYNFKFNQEFVFWPTIRLVRNYWVALFIAFSMFYLNSLTYESIITVVGGLDRIDEMQTKLEVARALAFALHFGLLCLPAQIWGFRSFDISSPAKQWLGVLATHVCSLIVLYISYSIVPGLLSL